MSLENKLPIMSRQFGDVININNSEICIWFYKPSISYQMIRYMTLHKGKMIMFNRVYRLANI